MLRTCWSLILLAGGTVSLWRQKVLKQHLLTLHLVQSHIAQLVVQGLRALALEQSCLGLNLRPII